MDTTEMNISFGHCVRLHVFFLMHTRKLTDCAHVCVHAGMHDAILRVSYHIALSETEHTLTYTKQDG